MTEEERDGGVNRFQMKQMSPQEDHLAESMYHRGRWGSLLSLGGTSVPDSSRQIWNPAARWGLCQRGGHKMHTKTAEMRGASSI